MTKQEFASTAKPQTVTVAGQSVLADVKRFATGSSGWHYQGKITIDGQKVQVNFLMTVVGSKEWAE